MWLLPENLLVSGSVFSSLVIFPFPLVVLGMASPYLVKLGVRNIENTGKTAGRIYALSTIGSIIGTFVLTFLTIPFIELRQTKNQILWERFKENSGIILTQAGNAVTTYVVIGKMEF